MSVALIGAKPYRCNYRFNNLEVVNFKHEGEQKTWNIKINLVHGMHDNGEDGTLGPFIRRGDQWFLNCNLINNTKFYFRSEVNLGEDFLTSTKPTFLQQLVGYQPTTCYSNSAAVLEENEQKWLNKVYHISYSKPDSTTVLFFDRVGQPPLNRLKEPPRRRPTKPKHGLISHWRERNPKRPRTN